MTDLTDEALKFLLFLLPGLITLEVLRFLTPVAKREVLETVVSALVFTVVDKLAFHFLDGTPVGAYEPFKDASRSTYWRLLHDEGGGLQLVVALGVGIIAAAVYKRLLRRTGRVDVWNDTLRDLRPGASVMVTLADGTRYVGVPMAFSTEIGVHEIFLGSVWEIQPGGQLIRIPGRGAFLSRHAPIARLDLLPFAPSSRWTGVSRRLRRSRRRARARLRLVRRWLRAALAWLRGWRRLG